MLFQSKKDIWMGIVIWATIAGFLWVLYEATIVQINIVTIVIICPLIYIMGTVWFNTKYKMEESELEISYGPKKIRIPIKEVQSVRETTNPFISPALSMYKVEINYGTYKTISVSPKDKEGFIRELRRRNPNIAMKS